MVFTSSCRPNTSEWKIGSSVIDANSNEIVLFLKGGLGNQLFQTLVGYNFARDYGFNLSVDISAYFGSKEIMPIRNFEIGYFANLEKVFSYAQGTYLDGIKKKVLSGSCVSKSLMNGIGYFTDRNIELFRPQRNRLILDGYFQNAKLLPSDAELMALLKFTSEESLESCNFRSRIGKRGFIAMHIRRGDYLKYPHIYEILTQDYYREGLAFLKDSLGDIPVVLFSDHIADAINWSGLESEIDFLAPDLGMYNSGEVLRLMSVARGILCSNSTFSWWAAKLGKLFGTTQEVVLPEKFINGSFSKYQNFEF
jgi:Glycosyl transferase family 11